MSCKDCDLCKSSKSSSDNSLDDDMPLSESVLLGPSLDENIIYLISFLPQTWLNKIGFLHDEIVVATEKVEEKKHPLEIDLNKWLKYEYLSLAKDVAQRGCSLDEDGKRVNSAMLESRKFVLNRLAELMRKKSEIETSLSQEQIKINRCGLDMNNIK